MKSLEIEIEIDITGFNRNNYNFVIYLYNSRTSDESGAMVGHNLGCGEDDEDDNLTGQYNYNQKLTKGKIVNQLNRAQETRPAEDPI